jgi:putative addiction module CopG family antidote
MRLQISPRNHEHINRKISSGRYGSADDVLHAALALLDEREATLDHELRDVREQVEKATAEADAGALVPAAEVCAELRQRNTALVKQGP